MDENTQNQLQLIEFRNKIAKLEEQNAKLTEKLKSLEIRVLSLEKLLIGITDLVKLQSAKTNELSNKVNQLETKEPPKLSLLDLLKIFRKK